MNKKKIMIDYCIASRRPRVRSMVMSYVRTLFTLLDAHLLHCACANDYENKIMLENSPIMLGIMPDAFKHLLCSKLCRHNLSTPNRGCVHVVVNGSNIIYNYILQGSIIIHLSIKMIFYKIIKTYLSCVIPVLLCLVYIHNKSSNYYNKYSKQAPV